MKHCSIDVKELQAKKELLRLQKATFNERIALSKEACDSMNSIERWNGDSSIRSSAMRLAKAVKAYLDKRVDIDALVLKYGVENAVEIVGTILDRLHSLRIEYSREWNKLVSLAMRQKVRSIRVIQKVLTVVRRAMKHFRVPRTHRSRRFRLAIAAAGSGDSGGSDSPGEPPRLPGLTFLLASLPEVVR